MREVMEGRLYPDPDRAAIHTATRRTVLTMTGLFTLVTLLHLAYMVGTGIGAYLAERHLGGL